MENKIILPGKLKKIFNDVYPCNTRIYGYMFNEKQKKWIYNKRFYNNLLEQYTHLTKNKRIV